jgi:predicted CXXCH cytochrome family protein
MVRGRQKSDTYREYLSSVHAHELLDRGNARAPSCVSCHGVHGAAPPEVGDVAKVCGRCHSAERRFFLAGPHGTGLRRKNLPECVTCHDNHAVQAARPERLAEFCAGCHGEGSPQDSAGKRLWTEYQGAATEIEQAAERIEQADQVPIATDDYRARLEQARTYLREALPAAHAVEPEAVGSFTTRARTVGAEIRSEIHAKLGELRSRRLVLVLFWFYLLLTLVIVRRYQRQGRRNP